MVDHSQVVGKAVDVFDVIISYADQRVAKVLAGQTEKKSQPAKKAVKPAPNKAKHHAAAT